MKLQHLNAEAQAAHQKLQQLDIDYERKNARLLKEQASTLEGAYNSTIGKLSIKDAELIALEADYAKLKQEYETLEPAVTAAKRVLSADTLAIENGQDTIVVLQQKIQALNLQVSNLEQRKSMVEADIIELEAIKAALAEDIRQLDDRKIALIDEFRQIRVINQGKIADYERKVALMELKTRDVVVEYNEAQQKSDQLLNELSTRQRALDERERNLRIREQKVEQGENKLLANSDLLQL